MHTAKLINLTQKTEIHNKTFNAGWYVEYASGMVGPYHSELAARDNTPKYTILTT